ncbi:hypothetical protein SAMN05660976_06845 [Nonomuraea pusilla]|uniref:Uncharacterized protein n=1 Tax=Nonomuraea pusilla TaxID=46177 RepID=A0A1H8DYA3_9ACTN|nr:hypothetical protein SAMN05660976_06845 [Nonomuraea pusilla]
MDRWPNLLIRETARTVRGALGSWPRTVRFCLMMAVMALVLVSAAFTLSHLTP